MPTYFSGNLALNKAASQSLTLHWAVTPGKEFYWNASYAVDGEKERQERTKEYVESHASCSGTNGEDWPSWWKVDLGAVYAISRVVIYGRTRDPPGRYTLLFADSTNFVL